MSNYINSSNLDDPQSDPPDDKMAGSDDALNEAGAFQEAPWNEGKEEGNTTTSGPITDDYADILNPGTTTLDEEFAGTGGIGSIKQPPTELGK